MYVHVQYSRKYRIAGNFRGWKLSRISRFFSHPRKFSPQNSSHATPIMRPVLTFRESFLHEMLLSYRSMKVFSLENFPLYGTWGKELSRNANSFIYKIYGEKHSQMAIKLQNSWKFSPSKISQYQGSAYGITMTCTFVWVDWMSWGHLWKLRQYGSWQ